MTDLNAKDYEGHLTAGQMLNQARTARNLTEADVAQQLLLSKQTIVALENDDYSKIVAPVYAKGYLRAYAQFLGLPQEKVLASFAQLKAYPEEEVFNDVSAKHIEPTETVFSKLPLRRIAYGIFGIIVIVLVVLIVTHSSSTKKGDEEAINNDSAVNLDMPVKLESATKQKTVAAPKAETKEEAKTETAPAESTLERESQEITLPGQTDSTSKDEKK